MPKKPENWEGELIEIACECFDREGMLIPQEEEKLKSFVCELLESARKEENERCKN